MYIFIYIESWKNSALFTCACANECARDRWSVDLTRRILCRVVCIYVSFLLSAFEFCCIFILGSLAILGLRFRHWLILGVKGETFEIPPVRSMLLSLRLGCYGSLTFCIDLGVDSVHRIPFMSGNFCYTHNSVGGCTYALPNYLVLM